MRPVICITLNGRELQLDDDAHALVTEYLAAAGRALDGNPDRTEILADLEQSIGDKAAKFLGGPREALDREQIGIVLDAIGPVEAAGYGAGASGSRGAVRDAGTATSAAGDARATGASDGARTTDGAHMSHGARAGGGPNTARTTTHRPGQLSEGAMISGVCIGLGKWLGVDATIMRIIAVVLAFVTGGAAVLAYLILMIILPYDDDRGAARGLPRTARSMVERLRGQTA